MDKPADVPSDPARDAPTTAFVLGGGGMLGAAEVGMLQALLERSITPDLVVGSSVGALNGAFLAAAPTPATVDRMCESWLGLSGRGVFSGSFATQLKNLVQSGTHLHSNEPLRSIIEEHLGGVDFGDLVVPFQCVAACIEDAAARWFSSGPIVDAVLASCAIPGLLPPVEIDGRHYLDGGLVRSVPIGRAVELGASRIFVLHVGRIERELVPPRRPWEVAWVAFEIARRHQFHEEVAALGPEIELHVLPTGSGTPGVSARYRATFSVPGRIASARRATAEYLDARS